MAQPDLTLPSRAPSVARYHNEPGELRPAALYSLVSLSDDELSELQQACELDIESGPGTVVRPAPKACFGGEPLRSIFDYHLQLGTEHVFDPFYFAVAVHRDWKKEGVLLVALDDDDLHCTVDKFFALASDIGSFILNLQIANMNWSELKELELPGIDRDNGAEDDDGEDGKEHSVGDLGVKQDGDEPEVPKGPPPTGEFCGVYVLEGADADEVLSSLVPGDTSKEFYRTPSNWPVLLQGELSPSSGDLVEQAFALHPSRCQRNKWLEQDLFFLADTKDSNEDGILLCQLSTRRSQRAPFKLPGHPSRAFQEMYLGIRNGTRPWLYETPSFITFSNSFDRELPLDGLLKHGGITSTLLQTVYKLADAIKWFPSMCRRWRFDLNVNKFYFICVPADWEKGVWLAHIDWDCVLSRSDEEMKALDLRNKMKAFRCSIDDAYTTLNAISGGKMPWPASTEAEHFTLGQEEVQTKHLPPNTAFYVYKTKSGLEISSSSANLIGKTTSVPRHLENGKVEFFEDEFVELIKQSSRTYT